MKTCWKRHEIYHVGDTRIMSYPEHVMERHSKFDWFYIRWCSILTVRLVKAWLRIARTPTYSVRLNNLQSTHPIVIAANHQSLMDAPTMYASLSFMNLYRLSPTKFMSWHKYYNNPKFKFWMYSTGCYPSHGPGLTGTEAAVEYAKRGYVSFIFPEGKRTKPADRQPAYSGISKTLAQLPDARLILVHIDWEPRTKLLSRPEVSVTFADAPDELDRSNPDAIMDAIYALQGTVSA